MKNRIMSLLLIAALAVTMLAGCGGGSGSSSQAPESPVASEPAPADEPAGEPAGEPAETPAGDGLRIAVVTSPSGVDDGSFNQDNYNGVLAFIEKNSGATVSTVQETDIANSVQAVAEIVADYDVIVVPGYQFAPISSIAQENPDKKFILIDSDPAEIDGVTEFDNILAMTFKEQESGFFAGIAAAMTTTTGKVAVVNGIAYPSNVNYQYGFESGVNYANAKLGTTAELVEIASYAGEDVTGANVGGNYVGDFNDVSTGKVLGNALIDAGVDILFVAAGNSGNGVFTAAKEKSGIMVIGCDVDQYDDGVNGDGNIVLTSGLKVMSINVERALTDIMNDTFQGGNVLLGADTDSTGFVKASGRHQLAPEVVAALDEAYALVKDGTIVPAANFNGHTPDNFPGLA